MSSIGVSPWGGRAAARWGHYAPTLLCGSIFAAILIGLRPLPGTLALTAPLALVAFVLASWLFMRQHDRRLCELCVSAMPLNMSEQAARYQRRFWLAHRGGDVRYVGPYLLVLIGTNFLPGTVGRIIWALVQCTMIYLIASYTAHRRLQPWCPWCRGDGGGGEREDAPPPAPQDYSRIH
ncbi:MAG: hypothetical protein ABI232_01535 [Jatrophihabitantaceae bacterium]